MNRNNIPLPRRHAIIAVLLLPISFVATKECGVYLAPSTIPGAGMGMYAGNKEYNDGDILTDSDIVIPVFELDWHNDHGNFDFLWNEYVWSATMFPGMDQEVEDAENIHVCSGGMGAAVNCMLPLVNAMDEQESYDMGMSGVSPQSPGAGAFTPYYGRKFVATKYIAPGAEIYADYGEEYFVTRDAYAGVPLNYDYEKADHLLNRFQTVLSPKTTTTTAAIMDNISDEIRMDLWNLIKDLGPLNNGPSRTLNALPSNETQIEFVIQNGGTAMQHYNESIRSLEWLEEHGQCMDNIKDGVSAIPDAGRGAFANRFIPKGDLVSPAPLIHLPNRKVLFMYNSFTNPEDDKMYRNTSEPVHMQLLLNYCFGHAESSLLLCPYGLLTALINHSHKKPNAKIQWAKEMRHPEWLNMTLREWGGITHTGLSFDFVALRDIQEDEEILIDYGEEWERAWQEHAQSYDPPRQTYVPAYELNKMEDLRIRTIEEESYEIYGVYTYCRETYFEFSGVKAKLKPAMHDGKEGLFPCRIIRRINDDKYIAEIFDRKYTESVAGEIPHDTVKQVLFNIPRDAFVFRDAQYHREHHQTWSFRYDMRIPDSMFPDAWRNLKKRV